MRLIDDVFKEPAPTLRQCVALRAAVDAALTTFKVECGVPESSNIKQCVRALASRVHMASDGAMLQLHFRDDVRPVSQLHSCSSNYAIVCTCTYVLLQRTTTSSCSA